MFSFQRHKSVSEQTDLEDVIRHLGVEAKGCCCNMEMQKHLSSRHAPVAVMRLLLLENPHSPSHHNQYFRSTRWKLKNYGQHRFIKTCGIIKCGLSRSPPIPNASLQRPATNKVEISIPFESLSTQFSAFKQVKRFVYNRVI